MGFRPSRVGPLRLIISVIEAPGGTTPRDGARKNTAQPVRAQLYLIHPVLLEKEGPTAMSFQGY